jgi:hypothetical protein
MCGRFALKTPPRSVQEHFHLPEAIHSSVTNRCGCQAPAGETLSAAGYAALGPYPPLGQRHEGRLQNDQCQS